MTDRIWNVWTLVLVLLGLVIMLSLVVIGADLRRAKTRRPRWKRRIVAAGLAILAALGAYPVARAHPYNHPQVLFHTCYAPVLPPPPPPSTAPATEPSSSQSRVDLLRQFEERGILAPPVVNRARNQYTEEA